MVQPTDCLYNFIESHRRNYRVIKQHMYVSFLIHTQEPMHKSGTTTRIADNENRTFNFRLAIAKKQDLIHQSKHQQQHTNHQRSYHKNQRSQQPSPPEMFDTIQINNFKKCLKMNV